MISLISLLLISADIETMVCNGNKLRFLFDNAEKCSNMKNIIKIDAPVKPEEKEEAEKLGLNIVYILEVEVRSDFISFLSFKSFERLDVKTR